MDDILLLESLPAVLVLVGSSLLHDTRWPGVGILVAGSAVIYTGLSV